MSQEERPFKGIQDAVTGDLVIVPVDDAEWDEIKAKQQRVKVELEAQAAAEVAAKAEAESDKEVLAALPTDDEINNAKSYSDLKPLLLRQAAAINVILKKLGLTE